MYENAQILRHPYHKRTLKKVKPYNQPHLSYVKLVEILYSLLYDPQFYSSVLSSPFLCLIITYWVCTTKT